MFTSWSPSPKAAARSRIGVPNGARRGPLQQEQLGEQLAHDARHDVAVVPQVGQVGETQLAVVGGSGHEAGHALERAQGVGADQVDGAGRQLEEGSEDERHLGQQLAVAGLLAGDLVGPLPGDRGRSPPGRAARGGRRSVSRASMRRWRGQLDASSKVSAMRKSR